MSYDRGGPLIVARVARAVLLAATLAVPAARTAADEPSPSWTGGARRDETAGVTPQEPAPTWGAPPASAPPPSPAPPPPAPPLPVPPPPIPAVQPSARPKAQAPLEPGAAAPVRAAPVPEGQPDDAPSRVTGVQEAAPGRIAMPVEVPVPVNVPAPAPGAAPPPPARWFHVWLSKGGDGAGTPDITLGAGIAVVPGGPVRIELNGLVAAQSNATATYYSSGGSSGPPANVDVRVQVQGVELAGAWRTGPFELWGSAGVFSGQANGDVRLATDSAGVEELATGSSTRGLMLAVGGRVGLGSRLYAGFEARHFARGTSTFAEVPFSARVGGNALSASVGMRFGARRGDP